MLAIIEFALIPIPVVFYRYGHKIREKSALIRQMREDKEKLEGRKRRAVERLRVEEKKEIGRVVEKQSIRYLSGITLL
jgi:hypothetical protein